MKWLARRSVSLHGGLAAGLASVAALGAVVLLGLVALEYVVGADDPLSGAQLAHEVADHVLAPLIVLLGLVAVAGTLVIRAALKPLQQAAVDVDRAAQSAPRGVRIDDTRFPREARPFAESVNRLLQRLDTAAEAQEAFAADAAHELKTPLAILALELDRLPPDVAGHLREDVASLARLVDQLLLLARLDAQSAAETPKAAIDLSVLAADLVASIAPIAVKAGRSIAMEDAGSASIEGQREAISAALRNLVENALRVTPEGGTVTVIAGPGSRLIVRDGGPGLSEAQLAQLVQRGQRAGQPSASGAGLGLTIVARIMAAHNGTLLTDADKRELVLFFDAPGVASRV